MLLLGSLIAGSRQLSPVPVFLRSGEAPALASPDSPPRVPSPPRPALTRWCFSVKCTGYLEGKGRREGQLMLSLHIKSLGGHSPSFCGRKRTRWATRAQESPPCAAAMNECAEERKVPGLFPFRALSCTDPQTEGTFPGGRYPLFQVQYRRMSGN